MGLENLVHLHVHMYVKTTKWTRAKSGLGAGLGL